MAYSIEAVYYELMSLDDDDLTDWAKNHRAIFRPPTGADIASIRQVNHWAQASPDYNPGAKDTFAKAADSFLIGHALAANHIVVTNEVQSTRRTRIKIPNAASKMGVRSMAPFEMLRAEHVRFVLG